jgi:MFS family permease
VIPASATENRPLTGKFAALKSRGYRTYLIGQSLANTGTWMQSIAQDWLVLRLTHSAFAVGVVMSLQFLPTLLLGVYGGNLADRYPKRRILLVTQSLNAAVTGVLAVLTATGAVRPVHIYVFSLISGLIFAVDGPTRQAFMTDVVPRGMLRGAISLNAAVFQSTRLIGPAVAGLLMGTVGTGWVFALNALCYAGPTVGLLRLRPSDLTPMPAMPPEPGAVRTTARYVLRRPHVACTILLVGVVGTFGLNFPIVLTAMATGTFGGGAGTYALFNVMLAVGSIAGALLAGSRPHTRLRLIVLAAAAFGVSQLAAAVAPSLSVFLVLLVAMGLTNLAFQAMANSSVQLWSDPRLRGRIMGLYMLVFTGGTPIGAPIIGALTSHLGARTGMSVCGAIPALAAAGLALRYARDRGRRRQVRPEETVSAWRASPRFSRSERPRSPGSRRPTPGERARTSGTARARRPGRSADPGSPGRTPRSSRSPRGGPR